MNEETKSDLDYIKNACQFMVEGGKFDSVLILACKTNVDGTEALRYKQVAGNVFATIGMAELYLRDEYESD